MEDSLVHHARGELPTALTALRESLAATAEPTAWVRRHLDEGRPMTALLREVAATDDADEALRAHARRLLAHAAPKGSAPPAAEGLVEPLSAREADVLRLLDTDLSGPEIARELYVSLNTLRTHTKRIFTKLGVTSRARAVRRARELGLL